MKTSSIPAREGRLPSMKLCRYAALACRCVKLMGWVFQTVSMWRRMAQAQGWGTAKCSSHGNIDYARHCLSRLLSRCRSVKPLGWTLLTSSTWRPTAQAQWWGTARSSAPLMGCMALAQGTPSRSHCSSGRSSPTWGTARAAPAWQVCQAVIPPVLALLTAALLAKCLSVSRLCRKVGLGCHICLP